MLLNLFKSLEISLGVGSLHAVPKPGVPFESRTTEEVKPQRSSCSLPRQRLRKQWTETCAVSASYTTDWDFIKKKPVTKWEKSWKNRLVTCYCSAILMTQRSSLLVWRTVLLAMAVQELQVWFSYSCWKEGRDLRCMYPRLQQPKLQLMKWS
jgi:hypothetical protein